jgi:hypothetical protein
LFPADNWGGGDLLQLPGDWHYPRIHVPYSPDRLKHTYENDVTLAQEKFTWAAGFLIFPCGITWIIGEIVNHFTIKPE